MDDIDMSESEVLKFKRFMVTFDKLFSASGRKMTDEIREFLTSEGIGNDFIKEMYKWIDEREKDEIDV